MSTENEVDERTESFRKNQGIELIEWGWFLVSSFSRESARRVISHLH